MSIKINVYNQKGESVGEMKLSDKIFGVKANEVLMHQVVVAQMANKRQVLAHTKGRGEVRGGGRKPWRQKGTGRARAGSSRSPIWKGGGVTFGPKKDRNFSKNINKKMRQKVMFIILSDKVKSESLVVLDGLKMGEYKTKAFDGMLKGLKKAQEGIKREEGKKGVKTPASPAASQGGQKHENTKTQKQKDKKMKRSVLIVNDKKDEKVKYSGRNLAGVKIVNLENINILDLLKYRDLVLTKEAVKKIEEVYN